MEIAKLTTYPMVTHAIIHLQKQFRWKVVTFLCYWLDLCIFCIIHSYRSSNTIKTTCREQCIYMYTIRVYADKKVSEGGMGLTQVTMMIFFFLFPPFGEDLNISIAWCPILFYILKYGLNKDNFFWLQSDIGNGLIYSEWLSNYCWFTY